MKHLPKHLRPRWRYLAVDLEAWPDADVDRRAFQRALWHAAADLLGDPGSADAALDVLDFRLADGAGEALVRARRGHVGDARAALACVSAVQGHPLGVRVRGVSGTVRAAEEKYMTGPELDAVEERVAFAGAERRAVVRNRLVDAELPSGFAGATRLDTE